MAITFEYNDKQFGVGDTVLLHLSVTEGGKSRTQIFEGVVIKINGEGISRSITVRKIASGAIGVERIVPLLNPNLEKIELKSQGKVRRAKLYYLRNRVGKSATRVKSGSKERVVKKKGEVAFKKAVEKKVKKSVGK